MGESNFWSHLERLVAESRVVVENPRGSNDRGSHIVFFPVDYGYLEGTSSMDGDGIDVFIGSDSGKMIDAIVCTVDLVKRDSEIKVLIGCTEDEKQAILRLYESFSPMRPLLVRRK